MAEDQKINFESYWLEIRKRLITVVVAFVVGAVIGILKYQQILNAIISGFNLDNVNIVLTSPYQFVNLAVGSALTMGILTASPFLAYNLLTFIRPALLKQEYKLIKRLFPVSAILFVSGFFFGAWILQMVINIYTNTSNGFSVQNLWDMESFLSQIIIMGISMSIVFQLPIFLTLLLKFHIVKRSQLVKSRRFVYAALLLFTVALPPTDILSLTLILIPLCFLFESALLFNKS
jgi:sec-independent protein translocase protein TatC